MSSNHERNLHDSTNFPFLTVHARPGLISRAKQKDIQTLAHALESQDKGPQSLPVQNRDLMPAPPKSIPNLRDHAKPRVMMQHITREDAGRIYTSRVWETMPEAAKKAVLEAFQIGFGSTNDVLKYVLFYFVARFLTKLAQNGAREELFDCNVER